MKPNAITAKVLRTILVPREMDIGGYRLFSAPERRTASR